MSLTFGSLFVGIGGFDLGFERAGMVCKWQVDNDAHCLDVRLRHWPNVPQFGDVKDVGREQLEPVDVICGGFPCQDLSVAGRRAGLAGERSGLWFEFLRVITELKPEWVVIENVHGLLSSYSGDDPPSDLQQGREWQTTEESDMGIILRGLAECRYWWAYRVLDLQYFGVPQRRRRVFIVASLTRGRPQEVLFERESSPWDTAPGREAGEGVAGTAKNGTNGYSETGQGWRGNGIAPIRAEGENRPSRPSSLISFRTNQTGAQGPIYSKDVTDPLAQDHPPAIAFGGNNIAGPIDVAAARNAHGSGRYDFESETFVFQPRYYTRDNKPGGKPADTADLTNVHKAGDSAAVVAYSLRDSGRDTDQRDGRSGIGLEEELSYTLQGEQQHAITDNFGVRRLTPVECERLQGFPDGWTDGQSDSARYRQLGNAVGVPHSEWIGKRIVRIA